MWIIYLIRHTTTKEIYLGITQDLQRRIREHKPHPKNIMELMVVLEEEWNKIEPEILTNLVESLPRRVQAVLDSHGNPTRY